MIRKIAAIPPAYPKRFLAFMAACACLLSGSAVFLTDWLHLNPCHLCIFQRLLNMILAALFILAMLFPDGKARRGSLFLAGLVALGGAGVAAFQSWEQWHPELAGACLGSELSPIERLVEWLGQLSPKLFMATGFCESKELVIFGLSLANWSFLAFVGFALGAFLLVFHRRKNPS